MTADVLLLAMLRAKLAGDDDSLAGVLALAGDPEGLAAAVLGRTTEATKVGTDKLGRRYKTVDGKHVPVGGADDKPAAKGKKPAAGVAANAGTPDNGGPARVPAKQVAALRQKAAAKMAVAPKPSAADVERNNAKIDEVGAAKFETNERGNNSAREASRFRLAREFGDGKTCGCCYCGLVIHADPPTPDLVISRDKLYTARQGGKYRHENLLPACLACNQSRGDTPFGEWMAKVEGKT